MAGKPYDAWEIGIEKQLLIRFHNINPGRECYAFGNGLRYRLLSAFFLIPATIRGHD